MKTQIEYMLEGGRLSVKEAYELGERMGTGAVSPSQLAAYLTVFRMRLASTDELEGLSRAFMDLCQKVDLSGTETIDLCGTGGDGKDTFNISTLTAFVVAGAGLRVAKHGNHGVSSVCGSSDVLTDLGVKFAKSPDGVQRQLDRAGICFLHAPLFHPAMRHVASVRRELGIKTIFNLLGPLVNPAQPTHQYNGVYDMEVGRLYHYILQRRGSSYTVVHSLDGYDEISLTDRFKTWSSGGERVWEVHEFSSIRVKANEIKGGTTIRESADQFVRILKGEGTSAETSTVLANAAFALRTAYPNLGMETSLQMVRDSLQSGNAFDILKKLTT